MVAKPTQVFFLVEEYAKKNSIEIPNDFANLRIRAEQNAVSKNAYANIFEIYNEIKGFRTEEERQRILQLEFLAELEVCVPNRAMLELFNHYREKGVPIILITDMYWTREYIAQLLESVGVTGYEKLYISCECKANKHDGRLFTYVLMDLQVKPINVTHYGDNRRSDILNTRLKGINSKRVYYDLPTKRVIYSDGNSLSCNNTIAYEIQQKIISCKLDVTKSRAYQLGYILLGPLLDGFSMWLKQQVEADEIENLLFLARDGKIMQRAFEAANSNCSHRYIYASRRALIVPNIWKCCDLKDVISLFFTSKNDTYGSLLWKMGLSEKEYESILNKYGIKRNEKINIKELFNTRFPVIYEELKNTIFNNSKNQNELLSRYLNSVNFDKNTAIVDVGWYGNMQRALQRTLKDLGKEKDINGYYVGVVPDSKTVLSSEIKVKGYLFEPGSENLFKIEKSMNGLMEWFFTAEHGSTLGYCENKNGEICPILDICEFDSEYMKLEDELFIHNEFQAGALDYVKMMSKYSFLNCIEKKPEIVFRNLQNFGTEPLMKDLELFGNIRIIRETGSQYFAKPKGIIYYLIHPHTLINDMSSCGWRIGFMKRLFRLPIPYSKAYFFVRKLAKKVM